MAKTSLKITGDLGSVNLAVDVAKCTFTRVVELNERIAEIRREESIFSKYPMEEGEKREDWRTRCEPLIEEEMTRRPGESTQEHLKRIIELKADTHQLAPKMIKAICETFQLRPPTDDEMRDASWLGVKKFIYEVLTACDIPADDYFVAKSE
jgi:hypothetical protein